MKTLIYNATIVNEGRIFNGSVLIEDDHIAEIFHETSPISEYDKIVEAYGMLLMPGVMSRKKQLLPEVLSALS